MLHLKMRSGYWCTWQSSSNSEENRYCRNVQVRCRYQVWPLPTIECRQEYRNWCIPHSNRLYDTLRMLQFSHSCVQVLDRLQIRLLDSELQIYIQDTGILTAVFDDLTDCHEKPFLQFLLSYRSGSTRLLVSESRRTPPHDCFPSSVWPVQPLENRSAVCAKCLKSMA